MRKIVLSIVSLVSIVGLMGLSSCNKEEKASSIQFTATMEDCADVHNAKTVLNGTLLQWVAGDEIIINSVDFTATPLNPPTMATFTTTDPNFATAETYLAYYPKENSFGWNNTVMLPSTQESEDGSLRGFPMHAYSVGSTNLQFRNLCGVLKLNLQKAGVTVTSIALTTDQKINGIYDVENPTSAGATLSSIPRYNAGGNTTTLVCNQSINTPHDFYIYLPANNYTGVKITINTSDGKTCTKTANTTIPVVRSQYTTVTLGGDNLTFRPIGSKGGLFSVSATQQVWFSQGNLQYQASTDTWRFAEHQYDTIGYYNSNISSTYSGWIDLFGWGTGSNPILSSMYYSDYGTFVDWGSNAISNGGNTANSGWRTLSQSEWDYLFNTRSNTTNLGTSNARYAKGRVNNIHGVILFPDGYTHPIGITTPTGINYYYGWNDNNSYTSAQWAEMEAAGAVFLPAMGFRMGTNVLYVDNSGDYWSSSETSDVYDALYVHFERSDLGAQYAANRALGIAVRLVRNNN